MPGLDPAVALARMAEATTSIDASTLAIRESLHRLEATQHALAQTHRMGLALQGFAMGMVGVALVGIGFLIWDAVTTHHEHAALLQALTVQTQALEHRLRERSP